MPGLTGFVAYVDFLIFALMGTKVSLFVAIGHRQTDRPIEGFSQVKP